MKAIIQIDVPDHQIGQEASIYFKDTMMIKGVVKEQSGELINREAVEDKLLKLCNELEGIFANIRMQNQDESVCGLCEYDCPAPYECPGFDIEDCFKLADEIRHKWQSTKDLPSVNPQERAGHWIEHNAKCYECSECHNIKSLYASYKTDYCPDCGARMESEDRE